MNDVRPSWYDLRIFAAIAATGSLTGAAGQLRLSQPTIGRRLQALEECLGAALLERTPRGMQLTAKGQALLPLVQQMEQAGDAIDRAAPGLADLPLGTVRIAAGPWNSRFMARRLPELQTGLPGIEIELSNEMAFANLARREADIAIRNRRPNEGRVAMRRLPDPAYAIYGARSYVESNPAARTEERYQRCTWIGFTTAIRPRPAWCGCATSSAAGRMCAAITRPRSMTRWSAALASRSYPASPARRIRAWCASRRPSPISKPRDCGWRCTKTCAISRACAWWRTASRLCSSGTKRSCGRMDRRCEKDGPSAAFSPTSRPSTSLRAGDTTHFSRMTESPSKTRAMRCAHGWANWATKPRCSRRWMDALREAACSCARKSTRSTI